MTEPESKGRRREIAIEFLLPSFVVTAALLGLLAIWRPVHGLVVIAVLAVIFGILFWRFRSRASIASLILGALLGGIALLVGTGVNVLASSFSA